MITVGDIFTIGRRDWICTSIKEHAVFLTQLDTQEQMIIDDREMGQYGRV